MQGFDIRITCSRAVIKLEKWSLAWLPLAFKHYHCGYNPGLCNLLLPPRGKGIAANGQQSHSAPALTSWWRPFAFSRPLWVSPLPFKSHVRALAKCKPIQIFQEREPGKCTLQTSSPWNTGESLEQVVNKGCLPMNNIQYKSRLRMNRRVQMFNILMKTQKVQLETSLLHLFYLSY